MQSFNNKFINSNFILNIICGQFWFKSHKKSIIKKDNNFVSNADIQMDIRKIQHKDIQTKKEIETENQKDQNLIIKNIQKEINHKEIGQGSLNDEEAQDLDLSSIKLINSEYVPLTFENINIDSLYIKHKILLKYIKLNQKMYIKSIVFKKIDTEIGCYNQGENAEIIFKKESDSLLQIIAKEKTGKRVSIFVINGKIVK
jgi:hypothetical protein